MAARLGNVLFWLGVIIAVGWLVPVGIAVSTSGVRPDTVVDGVIVALTVFGIPIVSVAVGWALRYVLGGR